MEEIEMFNAAQKLVRDGNVSEFIKLIQNNTEIVNYVDKEEQNTLLHWAALLNYVPMAKVLLEHDAEQYVNINGRTPLDLVQEIYEKGDTAYTEMKRLLEEI